MLQRVRESLTLLLIVLLPLHALFVTVGTKMILGAGHAPMTALALWKEVLLAVILAIAAVEILKNWKKVGKIDFFDACIGSLLILAVVHLFFSGYQRSFIFGFRYDFIPLIAFVVLRRTAWSDDFITRVLKTLMLAGGIVAGYGLLTYTLPQSFFTTLGYSDLHSLYSPDGPIAAYQQIGSSSIRRLQSTMSGPNHLGLWLLLPWAVALRMLFLYREKQGSIRAFFRHDVRPRMFFVLLIAVAITLTFSRTAWIAAALIAVGTLWFHLSHKEFKKFLVRFMGLGIGMMSLLYFVAPDLLVRVASTRDHFIRPVEAVQTIAEHPFGLGLGTAGPASNRTSDTCVFLEEGSDPSWAADRSDLCVFVGDTQVQPKTECNCPLLPENWYLQIGIELGVLGLILFTALTLLVLWRMRPRDNSPFFESIVFIAFFGIAVSALLLHAWEDAAVSFTVWILTASVFRFRDR